MSVKTKALIQTAGMVAIAVFGVIGVFKLLFLIPADYVLTVIYGIMFMTGVWALYRINLSQLEYEEKLKELATKN